MNNPIELHCHSRASDGVLGPADVVRSAHAAGVRTLALTDHDTLAGLDAARAAARQFGMHFVDGAEISTRWRNRTIHVVALDFDPTAAKLRDGLAMLQEKRCSRATAIAEKLEAVGLHDALARAQALATGGQITRTHFARLLVEDRLCRNARQAFTRFLGTGKSASVQCDWVPIADALHWIHAAGGRAVLAHPLHYGLSTNQIGNLARDFKLAGGDAIEVSTATTAAADVVRIGALAARCGLRGSAGSDFHDPAQGWRRLGSASALPVEVEPVWTSFRTPIPAIG